MQSGSLHLQSMRAERLMPADKSEGFLNTHSVKDVESEFVVHVAASVQQSVATSRPAFVLGVLKWPWTTFEITVTGAKTD